MGDTTELDILLKIIADTKGAKEAAAALDGIKKGAKAGAEETNKLGKSMDDFKKASKDLTSMGLKIAAIGTVMTTGIVVAAKHYVDTFKSSDSTSRQWLYQTQQIEKSYQRIGKVGATAVLPWLQKAAQLSEVVANYAEKNPSVAGAITGAGFVAQGAGAALSGVGQIGLGAAGIGSLLKLLGIGGKGAAAAGGINAAGGAGAAAYGPAAAAGGAGAAAVGGVAALGAAVGLGINEVLANATKEQTMKSPILSQILMGLVGAVSPGAALAIGAIRKQTGTQDELGFTSASKYAAVGGEYANRITAGAAQAMGPGSQSKELPMTVDEILSFKQFQRGEQLAQRSYDIEEQKAKREYRRAETIETEDYDKTRRRSNRDFNRQEVIAQKQFNRQRLLASRDFSIQLQRSDQDYAKSRSRAEEDQQFNLYQIALSGDAMQYYLAQRQFRIDKQRAEEDFTIGRTREQEDFSKRMKDDADQFAIDKARRLEEFEIRKADEDEDFKIRRKRAREQFDIQMGDMKMMFEEERTRRRQAYVDTVYAEIVKQAETEAALYRNLTQSMVDDYNRIKTEGGLGTILPPTPNVTPYTNAEAVGQSQNSSRAMYERYMANNSNSVNQYITGSPDQSTIDRMRIEAARILKAIPE